MWRQMFYCLTFPRVSLPSTVIRPKKTNAYLKEIANLCGVKKNLTFHLARHTFATIIVHNNLHPLSYKSYTPGKLIHKLPTPITNWNYYRKILLFLDHLLDSLFRLDIYLYCYATNFNISFL